MIFTIQIKPLEKEILSLIAKGYSSKEIGEYLTPKLSPKTVDFYKSRLLDKTGCPNSPALVAFAFEHKILTIEP